MRIGRPDCVLISTLVVCLLSSVRLLAADPSARVDFNRDIRPLLSDACFHCHGPDEEQRQADFRLDVEKVAFAAIEPGKPAESELYLRITAEDPDERMPPADSGRSLSDKQIGLIKTWIEQGAKWQQHWSFTPIERPPLPQVKNGDWIRNPLDAFVLARLEQEQLAPSPEADKARLIRRVTLDLTGLPPTPAEVDAFLSDDSPGAYEKVVDRLLASPRYGERMAMQWLDAARYADTNGYQTDGERTMWRWRDWVIEAYNRNMPFDQFTIEQLAGDLLPEPSLNQMIATGFNRNHRGNGEGGVIEEEYAVEYVVDRVETTGTVWLGLTIGCARCHEHKYDPISQKEFYQLFAFFNNVPERGKAVKVGNSPPMIKAPTRSQQQQLEHVEQRLTAAEQRFEELQPKIAAAQQQWEANFDFELAEGWSITRHLLAHYPFNGTLTNRYATESQEEKTETEPPKLDAGQLGEAAAFDGSASINAGQIGQFGYFDKFTIAAWIKPANVESGAIVAKMDPQERSDGYSFCLQDGKLQVNLVKRWLDDSVRVETIDSIATDRWTHVAMTYDGSRTAAGIQIYIDGAPAELKINIDELNQSFDTEQPLLIGGGGEPDRYRGKIDDLRIYDAPLKPAEIALLATPESLSEIAALPHEQRTSRQAAKLRAYFLERQAAEPLRRALREVVDLRRQQERLIESFPTVMVMQEMQPPRETRLLLRGEYDKPGEPVAADVPASLPPLPASESQDRLALARWLVSRDNPLTSRVTVNRYWQHYFGRGLVKTTEDFGSQGEQPSHPQLLDWLAAEFMESGWDVKALQKTIVMSAAYRQSSQVTEELYHRDPENRLLARGPRVRLSADMIRDQALAVSGLLVEQLGGPSVKPYQPAGLWKEVSGLTYKPGHGSDLYRRSLYTFWKRTVAPPTMTAFDASTRETCIVRQPRTNTPLQALALLNDTTFVEAARKLAERSLRETDDDADRVTFAFRLALARRPSEREKTILTAGYQSHREKYRQDRIAAEKVLRIGASPIDSELDQADLAAMTAVAGLILNLDEFVTKE